MDRRTYGRQHGAESAPSSPAHPGPGARAGLFGTIRRAPKAAAASARMAQVMMSRGPDSDDEDYENDLIPSIVGGWIGGGGGRRRGGSSPRVSAAASYGGTRGVSMETAASRNSSSLSTRNIVETAPPSRSSSAGRPSLSIRTTPMVPQTKTTIKTPTPIPVIEPPLDKHRDKRFSADAAHLNQREPEALRETSALQDQVDMLEEENYNLLEKLQLVEERYKEAEARSKALEKQVANLGEGVSLEARLLSRKEAALRQREEAVKAAMKKDDKGEEIMALQQELQSAKSEVATTAEQLREAELEANSLRSMTQRMILTQEEMEEVVLKRCWLARHLYLAVQHGIYPEIASAKYEHWSSLAPLPLEVVISAGQKAKNESWSNGYHDSERRDKLVPDFTDITGDGNIESMLAVEKGLRELASLKVEDAVALALAQHRRPNLLRQSGSDLKLPGDPKVTEAFELSQDEVEDAHFKQAWLTYFWRRAKANGVEEDIAEDRLQFWIGLMGQNPSSHDVVDVERGLVELRKLGIEQQLWEASRRETSARPNLSVDEEDS